MKVGDRVLIEIVDVPTVDEPIASQAVRDPPRPRARAGGPRLRIAR